MADLLWRLLRGFGGDEKDEGWLRKHPNAHVTEWQDLDRGRRIVMEDGCERRTFLTDEVGNTVAVMR